MNATSEFNPLTGFALAVTLDTPAPDEQTTATPPTSHEIETRDSQAFTTRRLSSPPDAEIEPWKMTRDWFAEARAAGGNRLIFDKDQFIASLREAILDGALHVSDTVYIHEKSREGKWRKTDWPLAELVQDHFKLKVMYEPVWCHAMAGLKWGALVGIGLKLLATLLLVGSVNLGLACLYLVTIGLCFIPRMSTIAMIVLYVAMFQFSKADLVFTALAAPLMGAILGCLPGMALGGVLGFCRRKDLPRALDASPEPAHLFFKAVVWPFLGGAALWAFYLFVFNPWLTRILDNQ